VGVLSYPAVKF